jgi:putative transposase
MKGLVRVNSDGRRPSNLLAHAGKQGRRVVSAFVATAFAQDDAEAAKNQWHQVADQLRPKTHKLPPEAA